jgi:hypothetical protein
MHQTADTWFSEFQVASHPEHSSMASSIPLIAGTPFEPATIRAASSETGICPFVAGFLTKGQNEHREVGLA